MKLRRIEIPGGHRYVFWCPGCKGSHQYQVGPPPSWTFNGNFDSPTFTPSLLVRPVKEAGIPRCHLFVTDGKISYCTDCEHELAGQTVEMINNHEDQEV
ncbi:MAG TPA: DUF6527 family protein [Pirellula sp.]|nr:DUF6527 family protein [Pirellula sp.]